MAGGLLNVGEEYKSASMSGFIREAAEQERIDQENKKLQAQQQEQTSSMTASAASIGLLIAKIAA